MIFKKLFPCALFACLTFTLMLASANAQTSIARTHQTTTAVNLNDDAEPSKHSETTSEASPATIKAAEHLTTSSAPLPSAMRFDRMLQGAIDTRLGSSYVLGATGPYVFDCSGFVWSSFHEIGINFTRMSARNLWGLFPAPREEEKFKFGTLVFFSGLTHVGIVADEKGFYHASRHKGVIYSRFDEYWLRRIDGFRRVPLPTPIFAE